MGRGTSCRSARSHLDLPGGAIYKPGVMPGSRPRPPRLAVMLALVLGAMFALLGCAADGAGPELLNVIDVAPREVDVGDRIEVLGTNLPAGEAKEAKVTFAGKLR